MLINCSSSSDIDCIYKDTGFSAIGTVYSCDVLNNPNITEMEDTVDSVSGVHKIRKNYDDVLGIFISFKTINYFPQNLELFFKNLKAIVIWDSKLKFIHQSDLKSFPKLVQLSLSSNSIEIIEEDLFDFNPNLEFIVFSSNKISHIHSDVFDNLSKLNTLHLFSNQCISMSATKNTKQLEDLIWTIKNECPSP